MLESLVEGCLIPVVTNRGKPAFVLTGFPLCVCGLVGTVESGCRLRVGRASRSGSSVRAVTCGYREETACVFIFMFPLHSVAAVSSSVHFPSFLLHSSSVAISYPFILNHPFSLSFSFSFLFLNIILSFLRVVCFLLTKRPIRWNPKINKQTVLSVQMKS